MAIGKTTGLAMVHFAVAFGVASMATGRPVIGGLLALVEPTVDADAFHLHEQTLQGATARRATPAV